jgi:hypothetical protein
VFSATSRYRALAQYIVEDHRGRKVSVVPVPADPGEGLLGIHVLLQGQRLDYLAALYLSDPAAFWRICERNEVMLAEALTEAPEIEIPGMQG